MCDFDVENKFNTPFVMFYIVLSHQLAKRIK